MIQKTVIFLTILLGLSQQKCDEGCLKCGADNLCHVCNFKQGYINKAGLCTRQVDTKCMEYGTNGLCLYCVTGYGINASTQKCTKFANNVDNCVHLNEKGHCILCDTDYYAQAGACLPVKTPIANCRYYSGENRCQKCKPQFSASSNFKSCNKDPQKENCLIQSNFHCQQCKAGFFLNSNNYIHELFKTENSHQASDFLLTTSQHLEKNSLPSPCTPLAVTNCAEPVSAYECGKCDNQFYLTAEKNCRAFPFVVIPNCVKYLSSNQCSQCKNEFFLSSDKSKCSKHTATILNCLLYSENLDETCTQCADLHFSKGSSCNLRTLPKISHCLAFAWDKDECKTCAQGHQLTDDRQACLAAIPNCSAYQAGSNVNSEKLACSKCTNGHYVDSATKSCVQGSVANCLEYSDSSTCSSCQHQYFLTNNKCQKHSDISSCVTYSPTEAKECKECKSGSYPFALENVCLSATAIPNCHRYSDANTCSECVESFQLSQGTCNMIPAELNCANITGLNCTKCKDNYFLFQGKCYAFHEYQKENCHEVTAHSTLVQGHVGKLHCQTCKTGTLFFGLSNRSVCLNANTIPAASLVAGCKKYSFTTALICTECQDTMFLVDGATPTCVSTCENVFKVEITFEANGDLNQGKIKEIKKNVCNPENKNKVYVMDQTGGTPSVLLGSCLQNQLGEFSDQVSSYNVAKNEFTFNYQHPVFKSCKENTVTYYPSDSANSKCLHFEAKNDSAPTNLYCVTCQKGWSGKVKKEGDFSYLSCDTKISGCSDDVFGGFLNNRSSQLAHNILSSIHYACHSCAPGYIPFFFAALDANKKFNDSAKHQYQPFTLTNQILKQDDGQEQQTQCLSPKRESFGMSEAQWTLTFPANCGLALVNTDVQKSFNGDSQTIFCNECAEGYRKVSDPSTHVLTQCIKIENCKANRIIKWVNSCGECEATHAWNWSSQTGIKFDECVLKEVPNCLAVFNGENVQQCKYCDKGFDLVEGKCQKYFVPKCQNFTDQQILIESPVVNTLALNNFWLVAHLQSNLGCNACVSEAGVTYLPVLNFLGTHEACVSNDIQQKQPNLKFGNLIPKCLLYSGSDFTCSVCSPGFILKNSNLECIDDVSFQGCVEVSSTNLCVKCDKLTHLIKNKCVTGKIENCVSYDPSLKEQECTQCKTGFRPSPNRRECVVSNLKFCKTQGDAAETSCSTCEADGLTFKYDNSSGSSYCFPPLPELNCETLENPTAANKIASLKCQVCKPGYFLSTIKSLFNANICLNNQHEGFRCLEFETTADFFTNKNKCKKCQNEYYVDSFGYNCLTRTVNIEFCLSYRNDSQLCSECQQGYFPSPDQKSCLLYPTGVKECRDYTDEKTCKDCNANFYLKDNACHEVELASRVENCLYYNPYQKCVFCNSNKALELNACVEPLAKNCVTFESKTRCKTCEDDYYLLLDQATKNMNCVQRKIPFCLKLDPTNGSCASCQQQYYVTDSGICRIAKLIENCLVYKSDTKCQKCAVNSYVSEDETQCDIQGAGVLHKFLNCDFLLYKPEKKCLVCKPGTFFKDGKCVACDAGEGCDICDFQNDKQCLLCKDGYYMPSHKGGCMLQPFQDFAKIPVQKISSGAAVVKPLIMVLFFVLSQ